jgi:hypothetical protein
MAWDSSRPVPWQRLIREWLIYVAIMVAIVFIAVQPSSRVGAFTGLFVSGPAYLAFGAVLAKFGYSRDRLRRATPPTRSDVTPTRSRPAPTKRTGGGTPRRR